MSSTTCPLGECGLPADVLERYVLESTSGPIEHGVVICAAGHRYNLPIDMLPGANHAGRESQLPPDPFGDAPASLNGFHSHGLEPDAADPDLFNPDAL